MSKLRIGVVGVGHIGKNHARVMAELGGVEFAAVYDKDARLAKEVASAHGAEAAGSLDEFAERVDAATVAASTGFLPMRRCRTMFSTSTIASSTRMPTTSDSASSVRMFSV